MIRTYSPNAFRTDKVGIVHFNQVGSSLHQDAGRDAQNLANKFGLHVIGVDRPGSGQLLPRPGIGRRLSRDYTAAMARAGKRAAREAEALGLEWIIACGRSAGAVGALAVACTDTLPVRGIYAAEPVGLYETTPKAGRKYFADYNKLQAQLVGDTEGHPDLVRPNPTDTTGVTKLLRVASIVPYFMNDSHNNRNLWSQPVGLACASYIAREKPEIATTIDFAETSLGLGTDPAIFEQLVALEGVRAATEGAQPFRVRRPENTVHSSYDNRDFLANQMVPVVQEVFEHYPAAA